jgi:penicillin-binding protein 1C
LGGVGITLKDLVTLYTGIGNGGIISPLRFSVADTLGEQQRLLSEAASWYLARILEETLPPPELIASADIQRPRPIAYKTGTSYGFRDAWAVGFDRDYTVGVWVGRPDGSPSPGHYGRNTAAPLLFRVFELLPQPSPQPPEPLPEGVLLASHDQLPERLRHLRIRTESWPSTASPLSISFPVHGTTVELMSDNGHLADLPLLAQGGKRPLRWLVNGIPLSTSPSRRQAQWTPDGVGLVRITVLDAAEQSASTEVWIVTSDR